MAKMGKQSKKHRDGEIPVGSFSDIAFLLIIYFLVATSLTKLKSITADLPSGEKATQAQSTKTPIINLRGSETFFNDKMVMVLMDLTSGYLLLEEEALEAKQRLRTVWSTWIRIAVDENLVSRAEGLAWEHRLRGYDAIHLAAALAWQERAATPIVMATFDRELWQAAQRAGLATWPPE